MLLFIYGADAWRLRKKIEVIKARYQKQYPGALQLHTFDFSEHPDLDKLRHVLQTQGFFAEQKLVLVSNLLTANALITEATHQLLKNSDVLESKETTLIVWETYQTPLKNNKEKIADNKLTDWLKKSALSEEFTLLAGESFKKWAEKEMEERAIKLDPSLFIQFLQAFEGNTWRATLELEKLKAGYPPSFRPTGKVEIFDLVRALWRKDQKRALAALGQLINQGTNEFYILAMVAYAVRKSFARAQGSQAKSLHHHVLQTDLKIKNGQLNARFGLELLILRLTS